MKKTILLLAISASLFSCKQKESVKFSNYSENDDGTFQLTITKNNESLNIYFDDVDVVEFTDLDNGTKYKGFTSKLN